jgi:type 2 lantibiotic biosynthesis protein LanM
MAHKGFYSTRGLTEHLFDALSLTERASYLRDTRKGWIASNADAAHGAAAMHRWKSQEAFTNNDFFEERLRLDGLTEKDLLAILGLPSGFYSELTKSGPDWVRELERLYLTEHLSEQDPDFLFHVDEGTNGFLWIAYPLFHEGRRRFREGAGRLPTKGVPFDKATAWRLTVPHLFNILKRALDSVMVLELNVARVQSKLKGETPEDRFRSFCDRLRQKDVRLAIVREYPVLFRSLYIATLTWADFSLELFDRLSRDWQLIRRALATGADPGRLTRSTSGLGDAHRHGRTVTILEFSTGFNLVYKPRSQSVDVHFGELLAWVNQAGFETSFRILKIIDRGTYGWSECVTHQPCSNRGQVERFYQRLGGYLALFYILKTTDMHFENLLAVGEFPVPVDLETLCHGDVVAPNNDPAINAFRLSVMQVRVLPQRTFDSETDEGIDTSAFGAQGGQYLGSSDSSWEKAATDEMRLARGETTQIVIARNRPKLAAEDVVPREYVESLVTGFQWVYRLVEKNREQLQATGGLLDRFGEDKVRFVARPTASYAALLRICQHPDQLRNALDRDQALDGLWLGVAKQTHLMRLIPAELRDLQNGDIPMFTSRPDSRDLWSSTDERISDVFDQPALAAIRDGLSRLGEEDLGQQVKFIRSAIGTVEKGVPPRKGVLTPRKHKSRPIERVEAIDLACAVGDMLCKDALENELCASWIGITPVGTSERSMSLRPLDLGLYNGLPGCSLFLAYLAVITGKKSYEQVARKVLALILWHLDNEHGSGATARRLGAFTGLGGIIYALSHLGVLWKDGLLIDRAKALAAHVPALVEADNALDVIGGSAGAIAALEVLNGISSSDRLLNAATICGEHLLSRQRPQCSGAAWKTDSDSSQPLTGFSHGAAGIAWALLKLAAWSGDIRFRDSAELAIGYERSTFVAEEANWPDYRPSPDEDQSDLWSMVAWCHGAPGVGLARIDNLRYIDDLETRREIRIALRKTIESGFRFGNNNCLCHGELGNLDILIHAAQRVDDSWWDDHGKGLASKTLVAIAEGGYLSDPLVPPGLMMGRAGVGYGLLRLACPVRVPSVLILAPPAKTEPYAIC